jgi:micrococcal nuclease
MRKTLLSVLAAVALMRYECVNPRVIDGDTVACDIQLGFDLALLNEPVRMLGVDTPELSKQPVEANKAKDRTKGLVAGAPGDVAVLVDPKHSRDKYGRVLGIMMAGETNINATLLAEGLGKPYDGGKR